MKKTILTALAAVAVTMTAGAQLTAPEYYQENFAAMGREHNFIVSPWSTYGIDAKPSATMQEYFFPAGEPGLNAFALIQYGAEYIPFCSTEFDPEQNADQWLVSPEIEIKEDEAALGFTAAAYAGKGVFGIGPNPYKILLSTTGDAQADFTTTLYEGSINSSATTEVMTRDLVVPVNGYKGQKVRLAFVATGKSVGMTGFTNIRIGDYIINVQNTTPTIGEVGNVYDVKISVRLRTAVACPGLTAKLFVNDTETDSQYFKRDFFGRNPQTITQIITFAKAIDIKEKGAVNYRIELTPDYEGAPTTTLVGSIGVPEVSYLNNVVIEELTATGCGFCPMGIAALQLYGETYPGSETEGKVISIAIHDQMNYPDPMNEGVASYSANIKTLNGTPSLPSGIFNRVTRGQDVWKKSIVDQQIKKTAYNQATVTGVEYPAIAEGEFINGKEIKVKFDVKNAFNASGLPLNAAAVLIENNVKGTTSGYIQENYFANRTADFVTSNYGAEFLPNMRKFLPGGELSMDLIPADKMTYQHVARGIFPEFTGVQVASEWTADQARSGEITLKVPETVANFNETEVVVLIINPADQSIVASDIFPYSKYTSASGVDTVSEGKALIAKSGSDLIVEGAGSGNVSIFSIDGRLLGSYSLTGERLTVNGADWQGVVVVKVNGQNPTTAKLIF